MNKEDLIIARDRMIECENKKRTRKEQLEKMKYEDEFDLEKFILEHLTAEELLIREETRLQQTLNVCYMGAKPTENIYVCLGAYYNGMGADRIKSKKIYEDTVRGKRADMLYYINLENPRDRQSIPMNKVNYFERENTIIHLNKDLEVRDNLTKEEERYDKIRAFYLLELIKSDLNQEISKITKNTLAKVKEYIKE